MQDDKPGSRTTPSYAPSEAAANAAGAAPSAARPSLPQAEGGGIARQGRNQTIITEALTNGVFAGLAARIARVSARWAADTLLPLQDFEGHIAPATAAEFCEEIGSLLDNIMKRANGK